MATGLAIVILVFGAVLGIAQVALARARSGAPAAFWLGVVGGLTALWCTAYALEVSADGIETVMLLARIQWAGVAFIPLAMLMCAITFRGDRLRHRELAALAIPGVIAFTLAWTNDAHHLLWASVDRPAGSRTYVFEPGSLYVVFVAYAYLLLAVGTAMVVSAIRAVPGRNRALMPLLLTAIGLPWIANLAFHLGIRPADVDFTPVALSLTGMLLTYAILRLRILDVFRGLVPAGRDATVRLMADGVVVVDRHGNVADANPAACALAGRAPQEVLGTPAADAFPDWPGEVLAGTVDEPAVVTASTLAGRSLEITVSRLHARGGAATGRIVVVRDITDRVRAEHALQASERRYRELVENASDVVFAAEATGRVVALNRAGRVLLGVDGARLTAGEILGGGPGAAVPEVLMDRLVRHGRATIDVEVAAADGRRVALEVSARLIGTAGNRIIEGIARDVTERRSWEERLTWRALHDPLTELPNRTLVRDRLEHSLRAAARDGQPMALLLIDLDHFKDVNDTLGHSVGDRVLAVIGERLRPHLRDADTLGRLGGDEFAAVLPGAGEEVARVVAQRLLAALEQPHCIGEHSFALGASVGLAMAGGDVDADELLRRADAAMYRAKVSRRSVVAWSPRIDDGPAGRLGALDQLRHAVAHDELELHYQPQVRLRDGALSAVEALVRWRHPERGMLRPDDFVPLAEQLGVIGEMSRWVIRRALADCASWRRAGRDLRVAVNLSPVLLDGGDDLADAIRDALEAASADPSWLKVELTESAVVADLERGGRMLGEIAALGVSVAIDDFGVGYSSLAHLRRLPVSELKVDRLFVREMGADGGDATIVRSVVALGHDLGLEIVAEGIEDVATWQMLERMGCDLGQGFHVSPPLPPDDLLRWMGERDALIAHA